MRHAVALMCTAAFVATSAYAEGYGPSLTVLLDFQEAASTASMGEMQREIQQLLKPAGIRIELRLLSQINSDSAFDDLVLFRFKGNCERVIDPRLIDERGPLGFAHTADGAIQPFGEIACNSVRRAVESALWGDQRRVRDELFGRALGRVVAHELIHMIGNTSTHAKGGVFKPSLSGSQLIADHMELSREDADLLRRARVSRR